MESSADTTPHGPLGPLGPSFATPAPQRHSVRTFCVITPAFNAAATVGAAIASVLEQSIGDWTMVVVDDGSTDGTSDAARFAAAGDPRVRVVTQENAGAGAARNRGIAEAGDAAFLVFLDADDEMLPEYLVAQAAFMDEHPGRTIYSCNGWVVGQEGDPTLVRPEERYRVPVSLGLSDLVTANHVFVMACVARDAVVAARGFREDVYAEDYDLWLRLLAGGADHLMNPEPLGRYRRGADSKSADRVRELRSAETTVRDIAALNGLSDEDRAACAVAAERYRAVAARLEAEQRARAGDAGMLREVVGSARAAYGSRMNHLAAVVLARVSPAVYLRMLPDEHDRSRRKSGALRWLRPRSQLGVNIGANTALLGLQTFVGLWFAPYLVHHLGVAAYGMIPLANSVAAYLSVLEIGVRGSAGRYLSIALRRGDVREGSRIFGTTLWASLMLGAVLLPVAIGLAYFSPSLFHVPPGLERSTQLFFGVVLVMYLVGIVRSVVTVPPFVENRFDLQNLNAFAEIATRIVVVVGFFTLLGSRLDWVGVSLLTSGTVAMVVAVAVCRYVAPDLRFSPREFSLKRFQEMWDTSAWMMVNQMGTLLFLSIEMIVVNVMLGAAVAGRYGSLLTWPTFLRTFAGGIAAVVTPLALALYAKGDKDGMTRVMQQSVRILGVGVALPVGVIAGLGPVLLTAWLGPEFANLSPLLTVQVMHLAVNLAVLPLFSAQLALGKVKVPGIVTLVAGVVNIGLAVACARFGEYGLGVAIAGAVVLTSKNALFTTWYSARIQGVPVSTYLRTLVPILGVTVAAYVMAKLFATLIGGMGWSTVLIAGLGAAGVVAVPAYFFILTPGERAVLLKTLPGGAR
jgi:glycosyltransferase involved in cell wall biosynthesis/O-antigen/teichoic acid export membrane protein